MKKEPPINDYLYQKMIIDRKSDNIDILQNNLDYSRTKFHQTINLYDQLKYKLGEDNIPEKIKSELESIKLIYKKDEKLLDEAYQRFKKDYEIFEKLESKYEDDVEEYILK